MTKKEKEIYDQAGNQIDGRNAVTRRRWWIFGGVCAVIITLLGLWEVVGMFVVGFLVIEGFMLLIDWLCGEDVGPQGRNGHHEDMPSQEEQTMWDIFTMDQWLNHRK